VNARDVAAVNGTLGRALLRKYALTRNRELIDQAAIYAERAVQLDDSEPEALITLGELRRISGRAPEAIVAFLRALALLPNSIDARLGLADSYDAVGRAADANKLYREAQQLAPDLPDVYGRYGRFCFSRGRYQDAVRLFTTQTQLLPNAPRGYANLGGALEALGRYDEAMRAFQHSVAIHPSSTGYSNLGTCDFALGRYAEAAAAYEKATVLAPNNYVMWANLGDAYRWVPGMRGQAATAYATAIRFARQTINVNPRDAQARATVAACLAKQGDLSGAAAELQIALASDPTNGNVLYQAALIANLRGDREAAFGWLKRAIVSGRPASDLARDPEFANLRNDARFSNALNASRQNG